MKIGVVVSTYNRPDALVRVLEGLAGQSMPPHEVIVADDGSTDRTRAALGPFLAGTGLNLSHVWQADKGFRLARIRNRAIRESVCDYLVFLDGDCIPHPDFVSDHAALARKGYFFQGKRVIVGQQATPGFTAAHTRSALRLLCMALSGRISNAHHILRLPFYPGHTTTRLSGVRGCNMGFFRSDLEAVNGFNEAFEGWGREDSEIVVRLYNHGIGRTENPFRAICFHLWHPEAERSRMDRNDQILEKALAEKHTVCENGIRPGPGNSETARKTPVPE